MHKGSVLVLALLLLALSSAHAQLSHLITVQSSPPGASVYVDGKEQGLRGNTPYKLRLPRGPHKILLELDGHKAIEQLVQVTQPQTFTFKLALAPAQIEVRLPGTNASATGAEVFVDGQMAGIVPTTMEVSPGRHLVELRRPGFRGHSETVEVKPAETRAVWAQLQADVSSGSLLVSSDAPGDVLIDGQARGPAPLTVDGLAAGDHLVEVHRSAPGSLPWKQTVRVQPGKLAQLLATFTAQTGGVAFVGRNPRDVYTVSAQGMVCSTPCSLGLAPGVVMVHVSGQGQRFRQRVEIPSSATTVHVQHFTRGRVIAGPILIALSIPVGLGGALLAGRAAMAYVRADGPYATSADVTDYARSVAGASVLLIHAGAFLFTGIGLIATYRKNGLELQPQVSAALSPLPGGGQGTLTVSW